MQMEVSVSTWKSRETNANTWQSSERRKTRLCKWNSKKKKKINLTSTAQSYIHTLTEHSSSTWNKRNPLASDRKRKCLSRRNSTGTTEPKPSLSTRGVKVCDEQQKTKVIKVTEHTSRPTILIFTCDLSITKNKKFPFSTCTAQRLSFNANYSSLCLSQ